jgi:hypothetical protein
MDYGMMSSKLGGYKKIACPEILFLLFPSSTLKYLDEERVLRR